MLLRVSGCDGGGEAGRDGEAGARVRGDALGAALVAVPGHLRLSQQSVRPRKPGRLGLARASLLPAVSSRLCYCISLSSSFFT